MTNSEDPDGTARIEPSHQDLHYLQRYPFCSEGLKWIDDIFAFTAISSLGACSHYKTLCLQASRKHTYITLTPLNPTFI